MTADPVSEAEIAELRRLAEAAMPGDGLTGPRYAAFIAALNPATVLRILADREAAEEREALWTKIADERGREAVHYKRAAKAAEALLGAITIYTVDGQDGVVYLRIDEFQADAGDGPEAMALLRFEARRQSFLSTGKPSKAKETAT